MVANGYSLREFLGGLYYSFGVAASLLVADLPAVEHKAAAFGVGLVVACVISYHEVYGWSLAPWPSLRRFSLLTLFYVLGFVPSFLPRVPPVAEVAIVSVGVVLSVAVSKRAVIDSIAQSRVRDVLDRLTAELAATVDSDDINANVMLTRRSIPFVGPRYLTVDVATAGYPRGGPPLRWRIGEGSPGSALESGHEVWCDTTSQAYPDDWAGSHLYKQLNQPRSVLSVPIYRASDVRKAAPVGILNVDSPDPLGRSQFDDDEVRETVITHANLLGQYLETIAE